MNQDEIMETLQGAVALQNQGKIDQAEIIYRDVIAVDPDNFYALYFCGCICRETERIDEGIKLLSRAVFYSPTIQMQFTTLGMSLRMLKDGMRRSLAMRRLLI